MSDVKIINMKDLLKTKEAWTIQEKTTVGRITYIPFEVTQYGLTEKPTEPIEVYVKIDELYYAGQMTIHNTDPIYDKLVIRAEMPVFDNSVVDIPDDSYWMIGIKDNSYKQKYWYKNGKFFEFDKHSTFVNDNDVFKLNSLEYCKHTSFFKENIVEVVKNYPTYADRYNVILERIVPTVDKTSRVFKERNKKVLKEELLGNVIPIKNNKLIGVKAKEIGGNDKWPFAVFETFIRDNENEDWINTGASTIANNISQFCIYKLNRNDIVTDGELIGLGVSTTNIIHAEMSDGSIESIIISFDDGELLRYDPEINEFRKFNESDYNKYENVEIYGNKFKKYDESTEENVIESFIVEDVESLTEKDYKALKEFNNELKHFMMEHPVEIKTAKQEGPL